MINDELIKFVREQVVANVPKEQIIAILRPGGWTDADVAEAFQALQVVQTPMVSTPPVFEHPAVEVSKINVSPAEISAEQPMSSVANMINPAEVKPQLQSSFRIQTMPVSAGSKKKLPIIIVLILFILVIVGADVWFFLSRNKMPVTPSLPVDTTSLQSKETAPVASSAPAVSFDADLIKTWTKIPDEQNSVSAVNMVGRMLSKDDTDFLSKYFSNGYDVKNLPTVSSANAMGARVVGALNTFLKASTTPLFQCSVVMTPEQCDLETIRNVGQLLLFRSYVLEKAGKITEALSIAASLVDFGRKITAETDEFVPTLVGWILQKGGLERIALLNPRLSTPFSISSDEKISRINNLRNEHKNVFKFIYTRKVEELEYLADKNKIPSFPQSAEDIAIADEYRKSIILGSFNLEETKKYFYDSYKIAIGNVDLACGSPMSPPPYDFSSEIHTATTTSSQSAVENYVGKILYWTTFISLDSMNAKRCEVEDLINKI